MELTNAYKGTKIIETLDNYSIIEENYPGPMDSLLSNSKNNQYTDDWIFWHKVISDSDYFWNKQINLYHFVVSDWVARIPGLYWAPYSSRVREHSENEIAVKSNEWIEFYPPGKSRKVIGGIGTIKLPPNDEGKKLISVSSCCNASLGIPILIFPEVLDSLKIAQGDVVDIINARWQPFDISWAKRFASTKDIPRGYLIVDTPDKIRVSKGNMPVAYHPFSIMEYQSKDALLYDFVYLTIDCKVKNVRKEIEKFFSYYAKKDNRNGSYLLNPDMVQPLFEAQYNSPWEMQRPSEKAKLQLLYKRIQNIHFNKTTLDKLISILPSYYDSSVAIKRLATNIGISKAILQDDNAATMSAQLINYCVDLDKIEELTDRMLVEYPDILK